MKTSLIKPIRFLSVCHLLPVLALVLAACTCRGETGTTYTEQLSHVPMFNGPLIWVGDKAPSEAESQDLWETIGEGHEKFADVAGNIETFIKKHPDSVWNPSLESHLAEYDYQNGYFTPALQYWEMAWKATGETRGYKEHQIADEVLVSWLHLLASLGRTDEMKQLLDETKNRQISPIFKGRYRQAEEVLGIMLNRPDISYRCGTYALDAVAQALTGTNYFKQIWEKPSPPTGFSMTDLVRLSEKNHLGMIAVERDSGQDLVVPSVVHWKQNHYAAIIAQRGDRYQVVDPTFEMSKWLSADAINEECSGQFMVPAAQKPASWRTLDSSETSKIFGKGYPGQWYPVPCCPSGNCPCTKGSGGSGPGGGGPGGSGPGCHSCNNTGSSGIGMPDWTVTEPGCDLWVNDTPLEYQPSKGPKISFQLSYSQEPNANAFWVSDLDVLQVSGNIFSFGQYWYPSWYSFIYWNGENGSGKALLLSPGGGAVDYGEGNLNGAVPEFATNTRMIMETNSDGSTKGFLVVYPSGATNVYEEINNFNSGAYYYFITKQVDPQGNATSFVYTNNTTLGTILLQYVIDADGKTNTLSYTNISYYWSDGSELVTNVYSNYVSQITGPYGTVQLSYPYMGNSATYVGDSASPYLGLTNITDVDDISSSFTYYGDTVTNLATPYGLTTFYSYSDYGRNSAMDVITDPSGANQMFLYYGDVDESVLTYPPPNVLTDTNYVPVYRPNDGALGGSNTLDNPDWANPSADDYMQYSDSYYWGRQQFANMSSVFLNSAPNWNWWLLTTNDYNRARMRHFLQVSGSKQGISLSMERDPSPDATGTNFGEMVWYDYPGKPDFYDQGTANTPIMIIKVLPDHSEEYTINQLDQWNNITNAISTYSENGTIFLRTNSYVYAANGQDLLQSIDAAGLTTSYGYDNVHDLLFATNAVGEVTSNTYDGFGRLTSVTQPNGQITTNLYGGDGYLAQKIVIGISTNSYTWTNGLVYTHTDERGLTITNSWDPLNRLTNIAFPDKTSISYIYSTLDIVKTVDRMGYSTSYTYNPIRQKTSQTDAQNHTTYYDYCECGALYSITDALNNVTYFQHDNQGNLLQVNYPDGYSTTNTYNLLRQAIVKSDSSGLSISNFYNNQGLLTVSSNNVGKIQALAYDVDDRVTNSTDANNVSVGITYDNLSRIRSRSYPDNGIEGWGYTANISGPTSYTNQIGNIWLYGYDTLNRKTNETCVGVTTNGFAYNGAGDLLALTDGNNNTTTWIYDQYGRVTNKLDAAENTNFVYQYDDDNRLTNRWTPARGNTAYGYDAVGNLTNVGYHVSPPISLSYDADNRLSSMVDGIGTTAYGYDQVGQLLHEGGLWPSDTVSNIYQNRLRMELSLGHPSGSGWEESYEYDSMHRLTNVESSAGTFDYAYDPVKLLRVDELLLPNSAYITNTYDSVARLLSTALVNSGGTNLDAAYYVYNTAGQRTSETNAAGDYRNYTYDNEGELTAAQAFESSGSGRNIDWRSYAYDAAGNMLTSRIVHGLGLQTYGYNNLNEMTNVTLAGTPNVPVSGSTTTPATSVAVNGTAATLYADNSFYTDMAVTNGLNTFTAIAENVSGQMSTNTSGVTVSTNDSGFVYDSNGNLASDGLRSFTYDDENELIGVCVSNSWSNSFAYDGKMRRRIERDYAWSAGWVETNEVHFIYDGKLVVEERNADNNPLVSYTRGNDLDGTAQGAGGIGGMLARTVYGQEIPGAPATAFYHADGNGNITALMYTNQQLAAKYLYDPYGNMLAMCGPLMNFNKYRFSSKEWNVNAGLYYYGYRFYDPNLQRWINRDPIGNYGGINLFEFIRNAPVEHIDSAGLCDIKIRCGPVFLGAVHCGIVVDGTEYGLHGDGGLTGSKPSSGQKATLWGPGGRPPTYVNPLSGPNPLPNQTDYPGNIPGSCDCAKNCLQNYINNHNPGPPYGAINGPNSNTYAHNMLQSCGGSVNPIPIVVSTDGTPVFTTTDIPPGALNW